MAQSVMSLSFEHEDLDSKPRTHAELPGMVVMITCNLSNGEAEQSWALLASRPSKIQASERGLSQKIR